MKCFIIVLLIMFITTPNIIYISADTSTYSRVTNSTTYIYKTDNTTSDLANILVIAENSYFIKIIEPCQIGYKVEYNGIIGYCENKNIFKVSGIPSSPSPQITLKNKTKCFIRSTPQNKSSNILTSINTNTTLYYVGYVIGEAVLDYSSKVWYYVKVNDTYGYIYNTYIFSIPIVYPNVEELSFITNDKLINFTPQNIGIFILILCLPLVIIFILLFSKIEGYKLKKKSKKRKKVEIDNF